MATHRLEFKHDGRRFTIEERSAVVPAARDADGRLAWCVRMDGESVLEFSGEYPYRDEDLRKRVLEWYALQRPTGGRGG
ncbi:MAG TPA: hypothetical protein VEA99_09615 [Gemmatimonadaceae bacterium]|nr:hypothetical protein [Gemmatimonadaceae bacterium]